MGAAPAKLILMAFHTLPSSSGRAFRAVRGMTEESEYLAPL